MNFENVTWFFEDNFFLAAREARDLSPRGLDPAPLSTAAPDDLKPIRQGRDPEDPEKEVGQGPSFPCQDQLRPLVFALQAEWKLGIVPPHPVLDPPLETKGKTHRRVLVLWPAPRSSRCLMKAKRRARSHFFLVWNTHCWEDFAFTFFSGVCRVCACVCVRVHVRFCVSTCERLSVSCVSRNSLDGLLCAVA